MSATTVVSARVDEAVALRAAARIKAAGLTVGDVIKRVWDNLAAGGEVPEALRPELASDPIEELKELRGSLVQPEEWLGKSAGALGDNASAGFPQKAPGHRLLVNTDVLLDLLYCSRPQSDEALRVVEAASNGKCLVYATSGSMRDVYRGLVNSADAEKARKGIDVLMGLLIVAPLGGEECDLSMRSDEPDFEDGLIRACAELNDIDFILTRDAGAFRHSKVRSVTCAEYLDIVGGR